MLLKSAKLLVYTPTNEHFGIVPLEAMLAGVPVLATNTGGPLETVVDGKTGWLCPPTDYKAWTAVMDRVLHKMSDQDVKRMGVAGIGRVKSEFSDTKMAERLDGIIDGMAGRERRGFLEIPLFFLTWAALCVDVGYFIALQNHGIREQLSRIPVPPFILTGLTLVNWMVYLAMGPTSGNDAQTGALAAKKAR